MFQHSPLAFQCTSSILAQASLCPHVLTLNVVVSCGRGRASGSFFMRNSRATIFEFFYPFVDTPLQQNTVPVLC